MKKAVLIEFEINRAREIITKKITIASVLLIRPDAIGLAFLNGCI